MQTYYVHAFCTWKTSSKGPHSSEHGLWPVSPSRCPHSFHGGHSPFVFGQPFESRRCKQTEYLISCTLIYVCRVGICSCHCSLRISWIWRYPKRKRTLNEGQHIVSLTRHAPNEPVNSSRTPQFGIEAAMRTRTLRQRVQCVFLKRTISYECWYKYYASF